MTEFAGAEAEFVSFLSGADKGDPAICQFQEEETDKNHEETDKNTAICQFPVKILGNNPQSKVNIAVLTNRPYLLEKVLFF
jgi:hypothetical protein